MERRVERGLVLRYADNKESDKVLTVLTHRMGRLTVIAKGAKSRRSRISAAAQQFAYSEFTLSESHGWQYALEANTLHLFDGIRQDVILLSLANYLGELTEAVTCEESEGGEILSLLLNALYALDTLKRPPELVRSVFELKLMARTGFEPLVEVCAVCGAEQPREPQFDLRGGILCCGHCGGGMPLTEGALAAMRHILYGEPGRLFHFTLDDGSQRSLSRAAEQYVVAMLERNFSSLDFYKSLRCREDRVSR